MEEEEIKQKEIDKVLFDSIANKECETKEENKTLHGVRKLFQEPKDTHKRKAKTIDLPKEEKNEETASEA